MAISSFCYQPRVPRSSAENPLYGFCDTARLASANQQLGSLRFSTAAWSRLLKTSCLDRHQCQHGIIARNDTSNRRSLEHINCTPVFWPSDRPGYSRAPSSCKALPASVVEGDEEEGTPWEGAIIFKRSAVESRFEFQTTLERLGLSRLSSEKSVSLAESVGLQRPVGDGAVVTPVHITIDVSKEGRDIRVDGVIRTALALICNRCLAPVAERIFASFNLLLTEAPVKEPTKPNLGVVLGKDPQIWRTEADENVGEELDIDLDDKLHFPRDHKEIDLSKYLRDSIHLEIPAKSLCDSGCQGLCIDCGVNLNNSACRCGKEKKKSAVDMEIFRTNDRKEIWGPLEQLKKQLEEQQGRKDEQK